MRALIMLAALLLFQAPFVLSGCGGEKVTEPDRRTDEGDSRPLYSPADHPAAKEAMEAFGLAAGDILAVQKVVFLNGGTPFDSVQAVVTEEQWYCVRFDGVAEKASPEEFVQAREIDIYGSYIERVAGWYCGNQEWVVTFYLPVCFYEDDRARGHFDGILDTWAPNPNCNTCNGGWCVGYLCGSAWDGPGYNGWWNFNTCRDRWSRKVGKQVQRRWLYTWRNCGYPDWQIASLVRARVRY